jgi:hypothetical protein
LYELFLTDQRCPFARSAPIGIARCRRASVQGGLGKHGETDLGAVAMDLLDVELGEEVVFWRCGNRRSAG